MRPAIPRQRTTQPLLQRVLRIVTEIAPRRGRVGLRVAYIPLARRSIVRRDLHTLDPLERPPDLVQRNPPAVASVINLATNTARSAGFQHQRDNILDIREIAS